MAVLQIIVILVCLWEEMSPGSLYSAVLADLCGLVPPELLLP